ncbi:MAG: thioredoxin family protein [Prevotellaceae bacterium]|jgi:thiol-disulfide isomerase/thioredoxin|nr:thioredoxin family protein [Prevotellaceae bacterium]
MKKLINIISVLLFASGLCAQPSIKVEMPEFAGRDLTISLKKGLKNDTVFSGKLDTKGLTLAKLPMSEANFSGIASLTVSAQKGMDFIINRKDFTIKNTGTDFSPAHIQFAGSEENKQFLGWKENKMQHDPKTFMIAQLLTVYKPEDAFYPALQQEQKRLEETKPAFKSADLADWYAPRFAGIVHFLSGDLANMSRSGGQLDAAIAVRNYALDSLDIEALYTSGLWFNVINGLLELYQPGAPFANSFARDMSMILMRTQSLTAYEAFASDLLMICQQFGWDKAEEEIVNFLLNEQRIKNPQDGRLKALLARANTAPGNPAPPISGIDKFSKGNGALLVFYESGCVSCQELIKNLKAQYDFFAATNLRIISISADTSEEAFKEYSKDFPWTDRICDLQGFSGGNFKTYGILATPTMFLLDNSDKIVNRFSTINSLIEELKNNP